MHQGVGPQGEAPGGGVNGYPAYSGSGPTMGYPALSGPSQLDVIAHAETGDRNIPQNIVDKNSLRGMPAGGNFQFIDPTWHRQAPKAGVDLNRYPTAMSAPPAVQAQVAAVTPIREWGPNTVAALKHAYPGVDVNAPPTGPYHSGGGAVATAPATATTHGGSSVNTTGTQPYAGVPILGALGQNTGTGKSALDNAAQLTGGDGGGDSASPDLTPMLQASMAAAPGNARQAQIAAQAQQLAAAMAQSRGLRWGGAPFGSDIGQQQAPGMTLNSMGAAYG
jgi:hypothetical protein